MFTDRYVKLPIKVYDIEHKQLTGEDIITETYEMVNAFDITSYRPAFDGEDDCINITLRNGHQLLVYLNLRNFEKLINKTYEG